MDGVDLTGSGELVVAADGGIPAAQIERLGLRPGARVRVVEASRPDDETVPLAGSMPDMPDIDWDAFERAGELARSDLAGAGGRR